MQFVSWRYFLLTVAGALVPLAILFGIRRVPERWLRTLEPMASVLQHRVTPTIVGLLAAALVTAVWGSWREPGSIHDERAMLLQGRLFARGAWHGPAPAIPEFFEQMHVFVEPVVAAKYPPLHSALLAVGQALCVPGLVPVGLTALTAALLFLVARQHTGPWAAAAFIVFWVTAVPELYWRTTYLSETTTGALWAVMLYAYIRWQQHPSARTVTVMAGCGALMAATRPLTAVFLTLPVAVVVAADVWRARRWRHVACALAPVCLVGALLIAWTHETLGDWRRIPYIEYSKEYMPFDTLGFGVATQAASRAFPHDLIGVEVATRGLHAEHTLDRVPAFLLERLGVLFLQLGSGWRAGIVIFCLLGLGAQPRLERILGYSAVSLFAGYLLVAQDPNWTPYYLEAFPVVSFLGVSQFWRFAGGGAPEGRVRAGAAVTCWLILMSPLMIRDVGRVKAIRDGSLAFHRAFEPILAQVPGPAIVFVRYPANHDPHISLVSAPIEGDRDPVWVVRDLGTSNASLCAAAPHRRTYLLDVASRRVSSFQCGGS